MSPKIKACAVALAASLLVGVPAADARGHRDRDVPGRIASKLAKADRAVHRAERLAEDERVERAVSALGSGRRLLASAHRTAVRRIAAGDRVGPPMAGLAARADHRIAGRTVSLLDGAGDELTTAAAATLGGALDGRDAIVAAIADRPAEDGERYLPVLDRIGDHVDAELADFADALADDELTQDGAAAVDAAIAQNEATTAAVTALVDAIEGAGEEEEIVEEDPGEDVDYGVQTEAIEDTAPVAGRQERPRGDDGDRPHGGRPEGGRRGRPDGRGRGRPPGAGRPDEDGHDEDGHDD